MSIVQTAVKGAVGSALLGLGGAAYKKLQDKLAEDSLSSVVKYAKGALQGAANGAQSQSLISYSQAARVEPILLLDEKATYVPFIRDVIHTMSSLWTAYYLQAVALDTTLSGVKLVRRLDKFNPDRNLVEATRGFLEAGNTAFESAHAYQFGLPFPGQKVGLEAYGVYNPSFEARQPQTFDEKLRAARDSAAVKQVISEEFPNREPSEAELLEKARTNARIKQAVEEEFAKASPVVSTVSARDVGKMVTDIANLAVGQMIELTISENGQSAKIPVSIRLRVTGMPSNLLVQTLSVGGVDVSVGTRYRQWRAGEKRFWADLVFARDRIDAHRRAMAKDTTGYYNKVANRATTNALAELAGQGPSIGNASSIIVITEQTKLDLERNISGRISDFKTRERIFDHTYAMLMAVVDPEWGDVTIYHRGIDMPTELTEKDVKKSGGGNGPDIAEILKAYQLGNAPSRL